jgi:hypothetical protein
LVQFTFYLELTKSELKSSKFIYKFLFLLFNSNDDHVQSVYFTVTVSGACNPTEQSAVDFTARAANPLSSSLSLYAFAALNAFECAEETYTNEQLSELREAILSHVADEVDQVADSTDGALLGLSLLEVTLGSGPSSLAYSAENLADLTALFEVTNTAFGHYSPVLISISNSVSRMITQSAAYASYVIGYYSSVLAGNTLERDVNDQLAAVESSVESIKSLVTDLGSALSPVENPIYYEDARISLLITKTIVEDVVRSYRATKSHSGATLYVPKPVRTFVDTLFTYGEIGVVVLNFKNNLYGNDANYEIVSPGFFSAFFVALGAQIPISNLSIPAVVTFELIDGMGELLSPACVYFDEDAGEWSEEGVELYNALPNVIACSTTHLSDFAISGYTVDCNVSFFTNFSQLLKKPGF